MSIDWNYVEYRLLTFGIAVFVVLSALSCARGCDTDESTWPESTEFSELETGQDRFSLHGTNLDKWRVLVDHETGVQYIVGNTVHTVCPLLDTDGTPLLVLEAGE